MYLSIVIPAYNEERRIGSTLSRIVHYVKKNNIDSEIIVVDDGSKDNTFLIAKNFSEKYAFIRILGNDKNMGKGFSVRRGMLEGKGQFILFTDADNSTPIEEARKLLDYVDGGGFDIAIGSRGLKESKVKVRQPVFRQKMGETFNRLVRAFLYKDFMDTQCGFKCFSRKAAHAVFTRQRFNGFSFDIEILAIAKAAGLKIKEVPIVWVNSPKSRVNPIKDAFLMFLDIFRLKHNLSRGIYVGKVAEVFPRSGTP